MASDPDRITHMIPARPGFVAVMRQRGRPVERWPVEAWGISDGAVWALVADLGSGQLVIASGMSNYDRLEDTAHPEHGGMGDDVAK